MNDATKFAERLDRRKAPRRVDVIVLRTAYDGDADFIVTGDDDLLSMGEFGKTRIVRSKDIVDLFP